MYVREVDGEQYLLSGEEIACKQGDVEKKYCTNSFVSQDAFVEYQMLHSAQHLRERDDFILGIKNIEHEVDCLDARLAGVASSIRQESVKRDKNLESWVVLLGCANFATFCMLVAALY